MARTGWRPLLAATLIVSMPLNLAAQTVAGTSITNVAAVREAVATPTASNTVTLVVAERLDCTLTLAHRGSVSGATVGVVLTNTGNGHEAFAVAATIGPGASPLAIAVDDDGNGRFDPAHDHVLTDGITPTIEPGSAIRLFATTDAGGAPAVTIAVRAVTGSGTPGTLFAGQGDGGGDAVVGATGAAARLTLALATEQPPTIVETQALLASDGSAIARPGSVVTYTIVASFVDAATAANIVDPVPANTAYLPASLTLDGAAIADAGHVADNRLVVPLGAVAAGAVHRITFKAVIQ